MKYELTEDQPGHTSGLLVCCRYLLEQAGEAGLAAQIEPQAEAERPADKKSHWWCDPCC